LIQEGIIQRNRKNNMLLRDYSPALKYGAKILLTELVGSGVITSGNVYWVKKSTDTDYGTFAADHAVRYSDGTDAVYNTIQAAVDASTSGRKDVIFVCSGKWVEDVTVIGKTGLSIIGLGWGTGGTEDGAPRIRPNDATTKYPFTSKLGTTPNAAGFHILSRNVQIAGFYFDGGGGCAGIYAGGGLNGGVTGYTTENASGLWIHHNFFRGGSEGQIGIYLNGIRFGGVIEDNIFERWTADCIQMDAGNASNEHTIIRRNEFGADDSGACYGVRTYQEGNSALDCLVSKNNFHDRAATNTFTFGVLNTALSTGGMALTGNNFACNHPMQLLTTDWVSGNNYGWAGSATEDSNYAIRETTAGA
jgi:hypothetical protein